MRFHRRPIDFFLSVFTSIIRVSFVFTFWMSHPTLCLHQLIKVTFDFTSLLSLIQCGKLWCWRESVTVYLLMLVTCLICDNVLSEWLFQCRSIVRVSLWCSMLVHVINWSPLFLQTNSITKTSWQTGVWILGQTFFCPFSTLSQYHQLYYSTYHKFLFHWDVVPEK